MEITIDEAIKIVRTMHYPTNGDNEKERDTAIMLLLDTAKKYQKIKEIINNAKDSDSAIKYNWLYEQISGVMEDGTD